MKQTMNTIKEDQSSNHSDSDDWTLVSPPHSSGSSSVSNSPSHSSPPSPRQELELDSEQSGSNSSLERFDEDGLTEIDLNAASTSTSSKNSTGKSRTNKNKARSFHKALQEEEVAAKLAAEERSSSTEPLMPGFQPLGSATDDDTTSDESSRRSSLTRLELGEYVDFGKESLETSNVTVEPGTTSEEEERDEEDERIRQHQEDQEEGDEGGDEGDGEEEEEDDDDDDDDYDDNNDNDDDYDYGSEGDELDDRQVANIRRRSVVRHSKSSQANGFYSIKDKLDELSAVAELAQRKNGTTSVQQRWSQLIARWFSNPGCYPLIVSFIFMTISLVMFSYFSKRIDMNRLRFLQNTRSSIRTNYLDRLFSYTNEYAELEQLNNELSQCIKRQSPASFKYYMSEDRLKETDEKASKLENNMSYKPYRGLVCFGQEDHWRIKFETLRLLYDVDLRSLMQDAKKEITNEMLQLYQPKLQFKLILNQLEYLDFLENKRNKKKSEETINHLRAENLQLLRRLNQPNDTGYQKVVVDLESENSKLRLENEALKASLVQKAGPTFIKQSLELEQYRHENDILKQFHFQVAQDVSKSLRQFNLHTVDASSILDDNESLNSQLMLTRGYLRRLNEKIGTVLIENESLKQQLKGAYSLTPTNKANLPATHDGNTFYRVNNDSKALTADSCARNLAELREKNSHLEGEVERLNRECYKSSQSAELERSLERNLNRTKNDEFTNHFTANNWRQIPSLETAMDRRADDNLSLRNDDIVDELILFLTKFNNRIEKNGLAVFEKSQQDSQQPSQGILSILENKDQDDQAKIIPNYLRDEFVNQPNNHPNSDEGTYLDTDNLIGISGAPRLINLQQQQQNQQQQQQQQPTPPPPQTSKVQISPPKIRVKSLQGSPEIENNLSSDSSETVEYPTVGVSDTWFFKRAKQRKQLRWDSKDDRIPKDWTLKRAKLREKLRKASSYMGFDYHASVECLDPDCSYERNQHKHRDHNHHQYHYHGAAIDHRRVKLPVDETHKEPHMPRVDSSHYNKKSGGDKHKKQHRHLKCNPCSA